MMMNIKAAMQILKKISTTSTLFSSSIATHHMQCGHYYHWHMIKIRGIIKEQYIGNDMGII